MVQTTFLLFLVFGFIGVISSVSDLEERTDEDGVEWIGPIRKCPIGDDSVLDECVRQITKDLTPLFPSGISELGLRPLDPIEIKKFSYERSLGPINMTVLAKNTIISQLTNYKILKFRTDSKNTRMRFIYEVPYLKIESNYKLGGNVFFFPLTGTGPAQIEVFNLKAEGELIGKVVRNENGEEVIQVEKTEFQKMTIGDMNMRIRGLFEGNALLSSVVHYIGKRYAPQVFEVIRPEIAAYAGDVITHDLLNPILKRLPYIVQYLPNKY